MSKINKIEVKPLSSKNENYYLLITFCTIVLFAGIILKMRYKETYRQEILKNEISSFSGLNNVESSIYATLLNSLVEISIIKDMEGKFPTLEELNEERIPPYFKDKTWKQKGSIEWSSFSHGGEVHYLGLSSGEKIGNFLLVLNEENVEKSDIYYSKEKLPKDDVLKNFEKYESNFKRIVPYTGSDERKKLRGNNNA